jgi:hypothetical protein
LLDDIFITDNQQHEKNLEKNIVDDEYNNLRNKPEILTNLELPPSTKNEDVDKL